MFSPGKVFSGDYSAMIGGEPATIYTKEICKLKVSSGKIIACDPFTITNEAEAFVIDFPPGEFPVELAIARAFSEHIVFARIVFSNAEAVRWEPAFGKNQVEHKPGDEFGYAVDSGTACFMDAASFREYMGKYNEDADYSVVIDNALGKNFSSTRSWMHWQSNEYNGAIFSAGDGDGLYPSYVGYDSEENICSLVTDFGLLDKEE